MGPDVFEKQLQEMGYKTWTYPGNLVAFNFKIPHGRFRDRVVEIALQVPTFPDIPPPGPNIKPHLLPIKAQAGAHPFHGVHQAKRPTAEFQYWSRPFKGWATTQRTAAVYLAFLRTLFDFE